MFGSLNAFSYILYMKICIYCKKEKEDEEFSFKNKAKGKLNSCCKECKKLYNTNHYQTNKGDYLNRNFKRREEVTQYIKELKGSSRCSICEENHPACLDFHHIDSTIKEFSISECKVGLKKLKEEVKKCVVLCANCHRKHHYDSKPLG